MFKTFCLMDLKIIFFKFIWREDKYLKNHIEEKYFNVLKNFQFSLNFLIFSIPEIILP